jgi:hypothetical protein
MARGQLKLPPPKGDIWLTSRLHCGFNNYDKGLAIAEWIQSAVG